MTAAERAVPSAARGREGRLPAALVRCGTLDVPGGGAAGSSNDPEWWPAAWLRGPVPARRAPRCAAPSPSPPLLRSNGKALSSNSEN